MTPELLIRTPDGSVRSVPLDGGRISLGRSSSNELCYPDDSGLSRNHLAFEWNGRAWAVADLGSKNGTFVNGAKLTAPHPMGPGDKVTAGHLTIELAEGTAAMAQTVIFVDAHTDGADSTVVTSLKQVLERKDPVPGPESAQHVVALIRAGRELAGHRPIDELFPVILDLAIEAVRAARGVVMTIEGDELVTRAARGDGFRISAAVRDRVLNERASLLVLDAQTEAAFRDRMSIVQHQVHSMMAVPLESNDKVIGLIYVDSPVMPMPFTKDDLSLLTVMSNVAAIRIEQARLVLVEQAERLLTKDLEQAAEIQRRLLPEEAPAVPGADLAGYNAPCRGVGGDYYDFFPYPDGRVGLLVADVSGKGMPAALMVSSLQSRVQILAEDPCNLADMTGRLNRIVEKNSPANRFITFFFCVLNPADGELIYCNAGHNPPLVLRADGSYEKLPGGGLPLGLFALAQYKQERAELRCGDILVLFSDGVSEAPRPSDEEEYGDDRLAALLKAQSGDTAADLIRAVISAVGDWTRGAQPADDITLVIARRI